MRSSSRFCTASSAAAISVASAASFSLSFLNLATNNRTSIAAMRAVAASACSAYAVELERGVGGKRQAEVDDPDGIAPRRLDLVRMLVEHAHPQALEHGQA